jgi:hypothetical protein
VIWSVVKKQKPSGFFGTNLLAAYLILVGCDSVIIVGTTTSSSVRATMVRFQPQLSRYPGSRSLLTAKLTAKQTRMGLLSSK